jgi:small subunit ribosomal protein S11
MVDSLKATSEIKEKVEIAKEEKAAETKVESKPSSSITPSGVPPAAAGGKKKKEYEALINIYTSFNNTLVHVTDMSGRTITKITGGMVTKHGRLKANPTIAMFIAKRISEEVKDMNIKSFYVRIRAKTGNPAPGPGANAIMKSLSREGFRVLNILDSTRVPRGGPKKKGGRRGRRP